MFKKLLNDEESNDSITDKDALLRTLGQVYSQIQTHRNTLKQNNMNILSAKNMEDIDDMLTKAMWIEKYNKFSKLLPKYLRIEIRGSEELSKKFKEYINEFEYEEYKNTFLTKVVKYKNIDQLFSAMDKFLSGNVEKRQLIKDIDNDPGIRVYSDNNDVLVSMVFSKKASCKFGSQQWCISGDIGFYWDSYVPNKKGVQYFIWDFNKKGVDPLSKIGVTIYDTDKYAQDGFTAHNKSDSSIQFDSIPISKDDLKKYSQIDREDIEMMIIFNEELMKNFIGPTGYIEGMSSKFNKKLLELNSKLYFKYYDSINILSDDEVLEYVKNDTTLLLNHLFYDRLNGDIFHIINNDHSLSDLYEALRKDSFNKIKKRVEIIEEITDNLSDDQKDELVDKNIGLLKIDHFTDILSQEKLEMYVDRFPYLIFHDSIEGKLSIEKYKELSIRFPEIYSRVKRILEEVSGQKSFDVSEDEYRMMIHRLFERFNEGEYTDDWGSEGKLNTKELWSDFPKLDYLKDDKFIYSLFDDEEHLSRMLRIIPDLLVELPLEYVNKLYWEHTDLIKKINNSGMDRVKSKNSDSLKSYYENEGTIEKFDDSDLYVFNAGYKNVEAGESERTGKTLYEETLSIDNLILFTPFKVSYVEMMKMRARIQGDITTYGIWVTKGLLSDYSDDSGNIHESDLDEMMIDLIDKHKFKM